jgi:hypothetical protein
LNNSTTTVRAIKSRKLRSVGYLVRILEMRNAYNNLEGKTEMKRLLGRYMTVYPKVSGLASLSDNYE